MKYFRWDVKQQNIQTINQSNTACNCPNELYSLNGGGLNYQMSLSKAYPLLLPFRFNMYQKRGNQRYILHYNHLKFKVILVIIYWYQNAKVSRIEINNRVFSWFTAPALLETTLIFHRLSLLSL